MNSERRQHFNELVSLGCYESLLSELAGVGSVEYEALHAFFRGVALQSLGRFEEAAIEYEGAASGMLGDLLDTWNNLAGVEYHRQNYKEAARYAELLRPYRPLDADLLSLHVLALKEIGDQEGAERIAREFAVQLPRSPDAARWLIHILWRNGRYLEALLRASDIPVSEWNNRGLGYELLHCLIELDLLAVAQKWFPRIFGFDPSEVATEEGWAGAGVLTFLSGRLEEAKELFLAGLARGYTHSGSIMNLACVMLSCGQYEEGWGYYLARNDESVMPFAQLCKDVPRWQGEPVAGRTLVIFSEQGIGDVIQFLRFVPEMERLGAKLVFAAYADVVGLLANDPNAKKVEVQPLSISDIDYQARLLDLPYHLGIRRPEDVPKCIPYLFANPAKVAAWKADLADDSGFRVGIVWAGNPKHGGDHYRSASINIFQVLAGIPAVTFYGLQKGAGIVEAQNPPEGLSYQWLGDRLINFDDTAALIANLDLIISVDTSVAHLAAALGKPVWMLASKRNPDWRWTEFSEGNAWYPNLRVFRQRQPDNWIELIRTDIRPLLARQVLARVDLTTTSWEKTLLKIDAEEINGSSVEWSVLALDVIQNKALDNCANWCRRWASENGETDIISALCQEQGGNVSSLLRTPAFASVVACASMDRDPVFGINLLEALERDGGPLAVGKLGYTKWGFHYLNQADPHEAKEIWLRATNAFALDGHLQYLLGLAYRDSGREEEAAAAFKRALELSPRHYAAHTALASILRDKDSMRSWAHLTDAVRLRSDYQDAWRLVAQAFSKRALYGFAKDILEEKCDIQFDLETRLFYIELLFFEGDILGAKQFLKQTLLGQDSSEVNQRTYYSLLYRAGETGRALEELSKLAEQHPQDREYQLAIGHPLLRSGRSREGWPYYWRGLKIRSSLRFPEWQGEPLAGKSILIRQDQGQGDLIQFFPLLWELWSQKPRRMALVAHKALVTLIKDQGVPFEVVDFSNSGFEDFRFDYEVPMMALPCLFDVDLLNPLVQQPTLQARKGLLPAWEGQLKADRNFKIGICWSGGAALPHDYLRSSPLESWRCLWNVEGVSFYSLQKDIPSNEAAIFDLPLYNIAGDCPTWVQTISAIDSMDLIITVDTALAHVAGSLNKPTWILLSDRFTDFRWMMDREDCPWYPSVRLFRRRAAEPWLEVLARVGNALRERLDSAVIPTTEIIEH